MGVPEAVPGTEVDKETKPQENTVPDAKPEGSEIADSSTEEQTEAMSTAQDPTAGPQPGGTTAEGLVVGEGGMEAGEVNDLALARTSTRDSIVYPTGFKLFTITIALMLTILCVALDNTIIATAIPRITDDFNSLDDVGWYASAYLLTNCTLQLLFGKIYTYYSQKTVFLTALAIFEIGSLVCGAAPNSNALIVGRAIAGSGAGGLFSGSLIIVAAAVPLQKRPIFIGVISSMFGIASVVGPLAGGAFTEYVTWRLCFYINLPLGLITAIGIAFFFHSPPRLVATGVSWKDKVVQLDPLGTATFIPGIVCLLLALQWGGSQYAWSDGRIIALFVLFGLLMICFVGDQLWMGDKATVPPRIIVSSRSIPFCMLWGFCLGSAFFLFIYYLPIYFQAIHGATATQSGIDTLAFLLAQVLSSIMGGIFITRTGYYGPSFIVSLVFICTGAGLITTFTPTTPEHIWIGYQIILGLGTGFGFQLAIIVAQTLLPTKDIAIGSSVMLFAQILGGALFVSVGQNVFTNKLIENLAGVLPPEIPVGLIVGSGATEFAKYVPAKYMPEVLVAYDGALVKAFQAGLIMACLASLGAAGVQWKNIKKYKKQQQQQQVGGEGEGEGEGEKGGDNTAGETAPEVVA